ncbi:MAG: imidazole glycerol phosphate synthase cyclase subunit, partial [Candidatus Peribacteraceae bacterium]|nr:imidazole glycerol phosphate synthase cyclase subunit [Candidatus Peribacteraceae bacterium]
LLCDGTTLIKGVGFDSWRGICSPLQAVRLFNMREVDELVFLDIRATEQNRSPDFALISSLADSCFVPLAVGGGVRSVEDARNLLMAGADKVVLNSAAYENPQLVSDLVQKFGSQCVVISIDVRSGKNVTTHSGREETNKNVVEFAKEMEEAGAGEILLTSVERDGTMEGYDIPIIRSVVDKVSIPVIASGGAGNYEHMAQALKDGGASAIASSSMYHFTGQTPLMAKKYLHENGFTVRMQWSE